MRSARRLAQQAQCGSGQTSQTTRASHPAKRPMLNAMSAERYMPCRYARRGPARKARQNRGRALEHRTREDVGDQTGEEEQAPAPVVRERVRDEPERPGIRWIIGRAAGGLLTAIDDDRVAQLWHREEHE